MYGLFNTLAFTVVNIIFIVTNPYCVTGFDIIPALKTTATISFYSIEGSSVRLGYSRISTQCVNVLA
jgi:hypothetical protein